MCKVLQNSTIETIKEQKNFASNCVCLWFNRTSAIFNLPSEYDNFALIKEYDTYLFNTPVS